MLLVKNYNCTFEFFQVLHQILLSLSGHSVYVYLGMTTYLGNLEM